MSRRHLVTLVGFMHLAWGSQSATSFTGAHMRHSHWLHLQEDLLQHDVGTMLPDRRCVYFWGKYHSWRDRVLTHPPVYSKDCSSEKVHGLASTRVQDYGSVAPGKFSRGIVAKETKSHALVCRSFPFDAPRSTSACPPPTTFT